MATRSVRLDALRGAFVVLMIVYHAAYVASMFSLVSIELYEGFWWLFPRFIAAGFVTIAGWGLAAKKARDAGFAAFARRAGLITLPALAVTGVSLALFGKGFVFFGVLHLVALSTVLAWPLLQKPPLVALAAAAAVFAGGLVLGRERFGFPWLAWLGLRPEGLYPVDYLPLLPWFAWVALGMALHGFATRAGAVRAVGAGAAGSGTSAKARDRADAGKGAPAPRAPRVIGALAFLGRRSLAVYLVHLPVLYGLAWAASLLARRG